MTVAGIGCRRDCPPEDLLSLIAEAVARAGVVAALAAPAFKCRETGVLQAADALGLRLIWVDAPALLAAQPRCATGSARVQAAVGHASIAEACALAAAGPDARLLLPRIAGTRATCAVAGP